MLIRRLTPSDAAAFQALRLFALRECPTGFSSSHEEECDTALAVIEGYFAPSSGRHFFGAFDGGQLAGMVGVGRETMSKVMHKASMRGMYVAPGQRGKGAGQLLLDAALACIATLDGVRQLHLTVTADNGAARGLYESNGFHAYGREPNGLCVDGVSYDNVHMVRRMSPPNPC